MIPKIIHYCWFGGDPLPEKYKVYMQSWIKYCPDYKIVEWNESNFDVTENRYCREAYESKKWAFVSDYARLKIIYENGGIYLDTDVELLRDITPLIFDEIGFIGFQNPLEVNTGLGFAAAPYNEAIKAMLDIYKDRRFVNFDKTLNMIPCPAANTVGLMNCGLNIGKLESNKVQTLQGIRVYPEEYFNPLNNDTNELNITANTYTIHRYSATWLGKKYSVKRKVKIIIPNYLLKLRVNQIARRDIKRIKRELVKELGNE